MNKSLHCLFHDDKYFTQVLLNSTIHFTSRNQTASKNQLLNVGPCRVDAWDLRYSTKTCITVRLFYTHSTKLHYNYMNHYCKLYAQKPMQILYYVCTADSSAHLLYIYFYVHISI